MLTKASQTEEVLSRPERLLPIVARAFAELGYRRATTAQLAKRCGVRENVLYRAWPSKKAMFLASIQHVFDASLATWAVLLAQGGPEGAARRVLDYEAEHHGEFGLYRVVFAGLSELDDSEIRCAVRRMYERFHGFIVERIGGRADAELAAWAMIGVGTVANIGRELGVMPGSLRRALFDRIGALLLERDE